MVQHLRIAVGVCAAVLLAGAGLRPAHAQVLADRVPDDALAYAGWAGADALGAAYEQSHLKTFLNVLNLPALISERMNQAAAAPGDAQQAEKVKFAQELLGALARSPSALYVGPLDFSANPERPVPHLALISQIGNAPAQALAGRLDAAIKANRQPGQPDAGALAAGEFLLVYVGDAHLQDRLTAAAPPAHALADAPAFKQAMAHVGPHADKAAATIYIDGQAAAEMLAGGVAAGTNAQAKQLFPALADGLGLNSLRQFAWAGSFDGPDWQTRTFLGLRDRRPGALALLDNGPLSQASLKLIPKSATSAGAFRFDGMRLLSDITDTAAKINDQAPKQLETALHTIYIWSGIDVNRELLPAFGDEFVYYGSPEGAGNSLRGFTLANRLRDAKKGESAMEAIENFANLLIAQRNPNTKLQFQTQALPAPWDKVTAHVMPLDNVTPCWAISDGVFFFSLTLSGLQSALDMTAGNKPSILDNPQFAALKKKLGRDDFAAFSFADLPGSAPETYELVNHALTQALARTPATPAFVLPPLSRITPALGPEMRMSWTDAEGYHAAETGPFPLAGYLSPSNYLGLLLLRQVQQSRRQAPATQPAAPAGGLP